MRYAEARGRAGMVAGDPVGEVRGVLSEEAEQGKAKVCADRAGRCLRTRSRSRRRGPLGTLARPGPCRP